MSSGFMLRDPGKVKISQLHLVSGGLVDSISGIRGSTDFILKVPLIVTATTNTDFVLSLPQGAILLSAQVYTVTAYTGTTALITIGSAAGGAQYVASITIGTVSIRTLTLIAGAAASLGNLPAPPNIFVRIAQGATPTTVGLGYLILNYIAP